MAGRVQPLCINFGQLCRHIGDRLFDPGLGFPPFVRTELIELDGLVGISRRNIFRNQVKLGDRDIQHIRAPEIDLDEVLDLSLDSHGFDAVKNADSVKRMDDIVAPRQLVKARNGFALFELLLNRFACFPGRSFPKRNQHKLYGVIFNPSAERTRKHADRIFRKFSRANGKIMRLEVLGFKIVGKLFCVLFRSGKHDAGIARAHRRFQVIF